MTAAWCCARPGTRRRTEPALVSLARLTGTRALQTRQRRAQHGNSRDLMPRFEHVDMTSSTRHVVDTRRGVIAEAYVDAKASFQPTYGARCSGCMGYLHRR